MNGAKFKEFPVLIKFIDAKQPLFCAGASDEYALRVEGEYGKTEMWYVVDCEPGASLYFGVNRALTKEEFKKRIEDNTLTDVLCQGRREERATCSSFSPVRSTQSAREFSFAKFSKIPTRHTACTTTAAAVRMASYGICRQKAELQAMEGRGARAFDVLVGEPMGLSSREELGELEDVTHFSAAVSGAEYNVAVGLSRLDHEALYCTRLGDDPVGKRIF